ncbi:MAG: M36 family metallopeptidase [Pyrinomonadaceae bacterium]|nr:M36 family metallopeptidase [Pyrinomonadaceae bacterium]
MKKNSRALFNKKLRVVLTGMIIPCLILVSLYFANLSNANDNNDVADTNVSPVGNIPSEIDVRGIHGTPRGIEINQPTVAQLRALDALKANLNLPLDTDKLQIQYSGVSATPRYLLNRDGYLTAPSSLAPEQIARQWISKWRGVFRFSDDDVQNLKLKSRATTPEGTTILLFEQQVNNLPIYHGEVLVNVAKSGQIINVGGDNYPQLSITNRQTISASDAISRAAAELDVNGFVPSSLGSTKVLAAYGDLPQVYVDGEKFSRNSELGDDIVVEKVVFPTINGGRIAYKFTLTTLKYYGIMWQNVVDAQNGEVLRRISLTAFLGEPGGGNGIGRRSTYRPDIQDTVESLNNAGTAQGKVFDTAPTQFSGGTGLGRPTLTFVNGNYVLSTSPVYAVEGSTVAAPRGFRYSLANGRNEYALMFSTTASAPTTYTPDQFAALNSQVFRGFPDATNPMAASPFGWFYLPTETGGAEVTVANGNRLVTRAAGYTMSEEARMRNTADNSPSTVSNNSQPFAADMTALPSSVTLTDGRVLSSVFQSKYTEGNNTVTSDDRANDNEGTSGIKGFSDNRSFTDPRFNYSASYEFGGTNASSTTGNTTPAVIPATANPDVPPAAVTLFYYNNIIHDYLYSVGFTETFWNFQMDNFGKGGAAGDYVVTQVQDGSGVDNANMGTPAEGSTPRMQMYLFTDGTFRRSDGDLDFDVVAHEQYHGVSNRSAGKGDTGCLGITLVGESGGMGEGWSDYTAASMTDDDAVGEYATGRLDIAIRRLPYTNYRYAYGAIGGSPRSIRKDSNTTIVAPDNGAGSIPFQVHATGELWSSTLWDFRELLIMKQKINGSFPGTFFDGTRRLGGGASFFIGERQVNSVDMVHPVNYRSAFGTTNGATPTINAAQHFVRPNLVANEIAALGNRRGPLSTAVSRGAKLADQIVLRGLQLAPCGPSFVEMRDSMLMADREITGGENQAILWRAFTSHGIGPLAASTGGTNDGSGAGQSAPIVVEDFNAPADVVACETQGPLAAPNFTLTNPSANTAVVTIPQVSGATSFVVARSTNANGPFSTIATVNQNTNPLLSTTFTDNDGGQGLIANQTYFYQVHAARNSSCVGVANTQSILVTGALVSPAPVFFGLAQIQDSANCSSLRLGWNPATSTNPGASIVYDIYRVDSVVAGDGTTAPTFTPSMANRLRQGVTATNFTDTNLVTGKVYYYIVQARDANNGKLDTSGIGNTSVKFSSPTSNVAQAPIFANEDFESTSASNRFAPIALTESATPNQTSPTFQRVPNVNFGGSVVSSAMYAPDFDPAPAMNQGAASDFATSIGPLALTPTSTLDFDHSFNTENAFDGGILEVHLGTPPTIATLTRNPNNTTIFDLGNYIVQNGYTGRLDGVLAGDVPLNQFAPSRLAFTGAKGLNHTRVALGDFAAGGLRNPNSLPVYVVFRMTSDAASTAGTNSGWYIDNLLVNNFAAACTTTAARLPLAGRVVDQKGRAISGVKITLSDGQETQYAKTNLRGVYRFDNIRAGSTVTVNASRRGFIFEPDEQLFNLLEELNDVTFTGRSISTAPKKR